MFDVQRAEQDDGVLERNRSTRRVQEMPSTMKFARCTQMKCRKCCIIMVVCEKSSQGMTT